MERRGISPESAKREMHTNTTVIAAMLLHYGEADAAICGPVFRYARHLNYLEGILGRAPETGVLSSLNVLVTDRGPIFISDGYVNPDPTAEDLATMTVMAAAAVRRFGLVPRVALVSHSSFGSSDTPSAHTMRRARELIVKAAPDLEVEGEMHADVALDMALMHRLFPRSSLSAPANILMMPNLEAAHIAFNTAKGLTQGQSIGPLLLGLGKAAHLLTLSSSVRCILNMTALAAVDAQSRIVKT